MYQLPLPLFHTDNLNFIPIHTKAELGRLKKFRVIGPITMSHGIRFRVGSIITGPGPQGLNWDIFINWTSLWSGDWISSTNDRNHPPMTEIIQTYNSYILRILFIFPFHIPHPIQPWSLYPNIFISMINYLPWIMFLGHPEMKQIHIQLPYTNQTDIGCDQTLYGTTQLLVVIYL
jgi:hypothetical protein